MSSALKQRPDDAKAPPAVRPARLDVSTGNQGKGYPVVELCGDDEEAAGTEILKGRFQFLEVMGDPLFRRLQRNYRKHHRCAGRREPERPNEKIAARDDDFGIRSEPDHDCASPFSCVAVSIVRSTDARRAFPKFESYQAAASSL